MLPIPYEGKEPFIFISYAHKDSDVVISFIEELQSRHFRVWYDEGIDPGSEWPETIAEHLMECDLFIVFVSDNSMQSFNVRKEINFALEEGRNILCIHLEDAHMTPGMKLQLNALQSLFFHRYPNREEFFKKLLDIASGEQTKSEQHDYREIAIFKDGVTL